MAGKTLDLRRVSATSTASAGIRTAPLVCKMIDTSTCIGCKACEVACQEWNDLPPETTVQVGTYQTLPSTVVSGGRDPKSTRLNSSHDQMPYSVLRLTKDNT